MAFQAHRRAYLLEKKLILARRKCKVDLEEENKSSQAEAERAGAEFVQQGV